MYNEICNIIKTTVTVNTYGDTIESTAASYPKQTFCRVQASSFKEKQMAETRGKTADLTLIFASRDEYTDEPYIEYQNERYEVIDAYYTDTSGEIRVVVHKWQKH